ncbi:hypothetical protein CXZ13_10075 [Lactiplantibacillus plantarum]|nr:hypothetical protein CEF05_04860 [Lactiplantibacillus plantarum]AUH37602.1 hypothetical protein CXZ13_10075 [Lactiplantibacillus plantarum]AXI13130.1 hypothetical protein C6I22_10365 [Lactiplantibacillus plantarum]MCT3261391.1 hypothetical protein [Lactiplantibacillus plantarum]MCT4440716.1 hypothetical protein [Lactiplantibacillus plantarum]
MPTSGAGCQLLERSRHRFELTHNPRHLKYESYSKPEADHFQLRIIWLLSIVTQAPPVGKPLKWLMNGHLTWYNLSLTILTLELQTKR